MYLRRSLPALLPAVLLALAACGSSPPSAVLTAAPSSGAAPFATRLDASASGHPDGLALTFQFDLDGDGSWDTEASTESSIDASYDTAGTRTARVRVALAEDASLFAESSLDIVVSENRPPVAALSASILEGQAPLTVELDASGSDDPDEGFDSLELRFDFEGDGVFDTEFAKTAQTSHEYSAGRFKATVEVRDRQGLISTASVDGPQVRGAVDLIADTNRDGVLDLSDEADEELWTNERGAVFLANLDDDDRDGRRDAEDEIIAGESDLADLARLRVGPIDPAQVTRAILTISPSSVARVFQINADRSARVLLSPGTSEVEIEVSSEGLELAIEGLSTRTPSWDGKVQLTLRTEGTIAAEDTVALRASPVIFQDNTLTSKRLYVMRISDPQLYENMAFFNAVQADLPSSIELYEVDQYQYDADRWVQDAMQTGYQTVIGPDGQPSVLQTYLLTERNTRDSPLRDLVPGELLRPDLAYAYPGRSRDTSLNYGGNLEVAPPHTSEAGSFPLGRLIVGGGNKGTLLGTPYEDHMQNPQHTWLDAQELQAPSIEVSTEWLVVGHVDEIFLFVPNPNAAPGERPWKVVFASPDLAKKGLEDLRDKGGSNEIVFAGRETQTTVGRILGDASLMEYNRRAQARIDEVRSVLERNLDLTPDDIIEVPVLYEAWDFGIDLAAAFNPGIQNLMVADTTLFVPDPEGPRDAGVDIWQRVTREGLEALGLAVHFVDVFDSYHLNLGEAHCGTEFEQVPYSTQWWEVSR